MGRWQCWLALLAAGALWQPCQAERPFTPSLEQVIKDVDIKSIDFFKSIKYAIDSRDGEFLLGLLKNHIQVKGEDTKRLNEAVSEVFGMEGYNALHYAAMTKGKEPPYADRAEHVRILLDAGMDPEQPANPQVPRTRPLHVACAHNNSGVVKVLLAAGVNARRWLVGTMSPATMAARSGHLKVLYELKDAGGVAFETLKERDGVIRRPYNKAWNPLMYAINSNHVEVMRFLVFEVGWGEVPLDEVLAFGEEDKKMSKDGLKQLKEMHDRKDFEKQKEQYYKANPHRRPKKKGDKKGDEL